MPISSVRALAGSMRRIPPLDPATDRFVTEMVDYLEQIMRQAAER